MSIIKKKTSGDFVEVDLDECGTGVDECGIRNEKSLDSTAQTAAKQKTQTILNYLDLPVVDIYRDKERFNKIKKALAEDLFQVFYRQEESQITMWALTWTFFSCFFLFSVIYYNVPCTFSSTVSDCVCPTIYPFNYTTKNLLNENSTKNISMNISSPDKIGSLNNAKNVSMNLSFSSPNEIGPPNNTENISMNLSFSSSNEIGPPNNTAYKDHENNLNLSL